MNMFDSRRSATAMIEFVLRYCEVKATEKKRTQVCNFRTDTFKGATIARCIILCTVM